MADTWGPFHAAYIIAVVVYGGYALTIWRRAKTVRARLQSALRGSSSPQR